jgi:hypothetical protein
LKWQNPYLQGNDLNSIVMNGSIRWAVGAMGTVMKPLFEKMVGIDDPGTEERAEMITLLQNMPNPFSGSTRILWTSGQVGNHMRTKKSSSCNRRVYPSEHEKQTNGFTRRSTKKRVS